MVGDDVRRSLLFAPSLTFGERETRPEIGRSARGVTGDGLGLWLSYPGVVTVIVVWRTSPEPATLLYFLDGRLEMQELQYVDSEYLNGGNSLQRRGG
jgi:hypothetical protein